MLISRCVYAILYDYKIIIDKFIFDLKSIIKQTKLNYARRKFIRYR